MKNRCPECPTLLEEREGNYTTKFEPVVTVHNTHWQECPGCGETVLGPELAQAVMDLAWAIKDRGTTDEDPSMR